MPNKGLCTIRARRFAEEHPRDFIAVFKVETYQSQHIVCKPVKAVYVDRGSGKVITAGVSKHGERYGTTS